MVLLIYLYSYYEPEQIVLRPSIYQPLSSKSQYGHLQGVGP